MAVLKTQNSIKHEDKNNLVTNYPWFYSNIFEKFQDKIGVFFEKDFELRLMGITVEDNIFFYGDEYFVNKIPVTKISSIIIRLSGGLVSSFLDNSLGTSDKKFQLKNLTEFEARLIKSFTVQAYKSIEALFDKSEVNRKVIDASKDYHLTFYVKSNGKHIGKMILTVPEYMLDVVYEKKIIENFKITDFKKAETELKLSVGSTRIALNEIKTVEDGDIILLENSDINKMSVLWEDNKISFRINPNPSLIMSINNNGDNKMEEETNAKTQNMWDSILVDVVAEFDNVKLTLGELKQISEGLVIDVGSVYDNKIKLRVENQVVATGELVILNDRYGVRIESINKVKEKSVKRTEIKQVQKQKTAETVQAPEEGGDENFDYSDFEIEDESI